MNRSGQAGCNPDIRRNAFMPLRRRNILDALGADFELRQILTIDKVACDDTLANKIAAVRSV